MAKSKRIALVTSLGLLCALSVLTSAAALTDFLYQNRVHPRTTVGGLTVGGMSMRQAEKAIDNQQQELAASNLTVTFNDVSRTVPLSELGITVGGPEQNVATIPRGQWDWLVPTYWRGFFAKKTVGFNYEVDTVTAQKKIEELFAVSTTAKEAQIVTNNGSLEVVPSQKGESIGLEPVLLAVNQLLTSGHYNTLRVVSATVDPAITTEVAHRTRTEIESSLQPIHLSGDNRNFTIPEPDLYDLITYQPTGGGLKWEVSEDKLRDYLTKKIAGKINVKMVQKAIQSDNLQVVQEGRDGKTVDTATLLSSVKRTITERNPTNGSPIPIPVQTITFTEKIVSPEYVAGLFPGYYLDINLTKQKVFVMNGGVMEASWLISSGKRGTPTPVGMFRIKNKIALAQSRLYPGIWMRKWNALERKIEGDPATAEDDRYIYEGYGIHWRPCFTADCSVIEPASHFGYPLSHGCVRIQDAGADWIYDNIPIGTPVNIHY